MSDNEKPGKVVGVCPHCRSKTREGDRVYNIALPIVLPAIKSTVMQQEKALSIPALLCLKCGLLYCVEITLKTLREKLKQEESGIVVP